MRFGLASGMIFAVALGGCSSDNNTTSAGSGGSTGNDTSSSSTASSSNSSSSSGAGGAGGMGTGGNAASSSSSTGAGGAGGMGTGGNGTSSSSSTGSGGAAGMGAGGNGGMGSGGSGGMGAGGSGGMGGSPVDWHAVNIAPESTGGKKPQIVYDKQGNPHITYTDLTYTRPRHAYRVAGIWSRETIDETCSSTSTYGTPVQPIIDSNDVMHVLYECVVAGGTEMRYGRNDGSGWQTSVFPEIVDNRAFVVDSTGKPCIGHVTTNPRTAKLTCREANGWMSRVIETNLPSGGGGPVALFVAGPDKIYASYQYNSTTMHVAEPTANGWSYGSVSMTAPEHGQLVVDAGGTVHFINKTFGASMYHFYGSGIFWSNEIISGIKTDSRAKLNFDTAGNLMVVTKDTLAKSLQVARQSNATWSVTTTPVGYDPTIAGFDKYDQPAAFYIDSLDGFSLTEVPVGLPPVTQIVDRKAIVQGDPTAIAAPDGKRYIVFTQRNFTNGEYEARIAVKDGGPWTVTTPFSGTALHPQPALNSAGLLRIMSLLSNILGYAAADASGTWTKQTVATNAVNETVSFFVDAQDRPHVAYRSLQNQLVYAFLDNGGTWQTSTVTTAGSSQVYQKLVVDPAGNPYIAYRASGQNTITFARLVNNVWQSAVILNINRGFWLVLDGQNRPCIVHGPQNMSGGLVLECFQGNNFVVEQITPTDYSVDWAARDATGNVQVVSGNILFRQGPVWTKEILSTFNFSTYPPGIGVVPTGDPVIGLYDGTHQVIQSIER